METKKKRRAFPGSNVKDAKGLTVPFVFNNAILWDGATDDVKLTNKDLENGLFIIPVTAGTIKVQLFGQDDGDTYVISTEETTANIGKVLPYRVKAAFVAGTSATAKIVW